LASIDGTIKDGDRSTKSLAVTISFHENRHTKVREITMLLTITNLFPRPDEPDRGIFNMQFFDRMASALVENAPHGDAAATAGLFNVCLVPSWRVWEWRTIRAWRVPQKALYQTRYLPVFYLPVIGRSLSWATYGRALRSVMAEARKCDWILATWLYPDAVAAAGLARNTGKPLWIKVHGSDVFHLKNESRRRRILDACAQAEGVLCVSRLLADRLREVGVDAGKTHRVPNGVDRNLFCPRDRAAARQQKARDMGLPSQQDGDPARIVLFVGHLVEVKGPDILLDAWAGVQRVTNRGEGGGESPAQPKLLIVGTGNLRKQLENRAVRLGIADSVLFLGRRPHHEIATWMNIADCLCLPSRSEGMPNVVLESLACGTPVVATDLGEVPWLIRDGENGRVVPVGPKDLAGRLAGTIDSVLKTQWNRSEIAASVESYTWENAAERAVRLMLGSKS